MALPNDMQRVAEGLAKLEASNPEYDHDVKKAARRLVRRTYNLGVSSAVNANGNNAIVANAAPGIRMPTAGRMLAAYFTCQSTITAASGNNATLAIKPLLANGLTGNACATINTNTTGNGGSGDVAKGVPVTVTAATGANGRYAKGTYLGVDISENSSGVAVPAGSWTIDVEEEDSDDGYKV